MNWSRSISGILGAALLALPLAGRGAIDTNAVPDFNEVYDLLRTHLSGESAADLNRDAVNGLLNKLHGKVSLVTGSNATNDAPSSLNLVKATVYEGDVARLVVKRVAPGLATQITDAIKGLEATNHLQGLVIDLRYAEGDDYMAAADAADLFLSTEKPLLDFGKGMVQSKVNTNAIALPLSILVNGKTAGAAEALAAILRDSERAIILGSTTAGDAAMSQDFPLKNGANLRIATSAIKMGAGETLSPRGLKPDIQVAVTTENEQAYYANPFTDLSATVIPSILGNPTNSVTHDARPRVVINEQELMRERKARPGVDMEDMLPLAASESGTPVPEKPVVRDPVLGRGLDLVRSIAALHRPMTP